MDNGKKIGENKDPKPRPATVFHELQESYNRTDLKQNYTTAHGNAIKTATQNFSKADPRRGMTPGMGTRAIKNRN